MVKACSRPRTALVLATTLIPHMREAFMAGDRRFRAGRRIPPSNAS
nr:DUF2274 domain-containing protein [Xanthomonas sacchari]